MGTETDPLCRRLLPRFYSHGLREHKYTNGLLSCLEVPITAKTKKMFQRSPPSGQVPQQNTVFTPQRAQVDRKVPASLNSTAQEANRRGRNAGSSMSLTLDCGLAATTQNCQECGIESRCGWRRRDRLRRVGYFGHCLMHFLRSLRAGQISLGKNADAAPLLINYRDAANLMRLHQPLAGIQALLRPTGHRVARDIGFDACGLRI